MTTTPRRVPTNELQAGDVVLTHGMRVRLYTGGRELPADRYGIAWSRPGIVENLAEVLAGDLVPEAYLTEHFQDDRGGWVSAVTGRWVIKGNEHALWYVERGQD